MMRQEDYCTHEQSVRLRELGLPQEGKYPFESYSLVLKGVMTKHWGGIELSDYLIPTITLGDKDYLLEIGKCVIDGDEPNCMWFVDYLHRAGSDVDELFGSGSSELPTAIADAVIWLLENNHIKP